MEFTNKSVLNGKVVWLKSGGPAMTVKFLNRASSWTCNWFAGDEIKEHDFAAEQLTETDPNPKKKGVSVRVG